MDSLLNNVAVAFIRGGGLCIPRRGTGHRWNMKMVLVERLDQVDRCIFSQPSVR